MRWRERSDAIATAAASTPACAACGPKPARSPCMVGSSTLNSWQVIIEHACDQLEAAEQSLMTAKGDMSYHMCAGV